MGTTRSSDNIHPQNEWVRIALDHLQDGQSFVMAVVVGPADHPRLGQRTLVEMSGSDVSPASGTLADLVSHLLLHARVFAESHSAGLVDVVFPIGEGAPEESPPPPAQVMFSWCGPPETVWIFGAGHVGRALAPVLPPLGFRVTICDDRAEYVTPERFPDPCNRRVGDFASLATDCAAHSGSWAVLVTRGHEHDECILRELAKSPPRYVGMIGSERRAKSVRRRLTADGIAPEFLESICTPIGLSIGADSPAEIAVSIAAELVAFRRGAHEKSPRPRGGESPQADTSGSLDLLRTLLPILDTGKPAVLATVVARRGSAPRGVGAQMALFADGSIAGTIGGGCGEEEVKTAAREMILTGGMPRLLTLDLTGDRAGEKSDICGGEYRVFVELLK